LSGTNGIIYQQRVDLVDDLDELLAIWHGLDGSAAIPLLDGTIHPGLAIHNLVEEATNLSEAIRLLVANDMSLPVVPLIRLSMECAVTAAWWAGDPSRVRYSAAEEVRQKIHLASGLAGVAAGEHFDEVNSYLKARAEALGSPTDDAKRFEARCAATPGFEWAYPQYRLLSQTSHAGTALVTEYTYPDENQLGVAINQRPTWSAQPVGYPMQVVILTIALSVYDAVLPQRQLQNMLQEFASKRGFGDIVDGVLEGIVGT
jgi:hypothetical protein